MILRPRLNPTPTITRLPPGPVVEPPPDLDPALALWGWRQLPRPGLDEAIEGDGGGVSLVEVPGDTEAVGGWVW